MNDEQEKSLSAEDMAKMETSGFNMALHSKEVALHLAKTEIAKVQLTLLSANYTLKSKEVEQLNTELPVARKEQKRLADKHKKLAKELQEKYGLTGSNWGYDPMTGEIKN
ncbi:MAG: hypothetical protein KAG61_03620 [Bacteriovoracaceae bacterium]|nr:hypothetical protein [Bacteriovoracaceae bacterium]